jgi:hypothetical protein
MNPGLFGRAQRGGATDPQSVAIVVDAHHKTTSESDQGDAGLEGLAVGPEVHNADLGLGGAVGGIDDGLEGYALLQEIERALVGRDGGEVVGGGGELNSLPCEGVEGLEEELIAVFGEAGGVAVGVPVGIPVIEEDGFGDGGVVEIGERELADAEVPVGMAGPLDLEVVPVVEGEVDLFALEFVDDGAVVDAVDGDVAAVAMVEEAIAAFDEGGDVDGGDAELVLIDVEVGEGLLVGGVDLEEDYVLGCVIVEDDLREELPVGLFVEATEVPGERGVEVVGFDVLAAEDVLIAEDGGEGLEFDELWTEGAVGVANEAEVHGHEVGLGVLVGHAVLRGDALLGGLQVGGVVEELMGELGAGLGELFHEGVGKEAGGFGDAKVDGGSGAPVELGEQVFIFGGAELRVEAVAIGLQHGS